MSPRLPLIVLFGLAVTAFLTACSSTSTGGTASPSTTADAPSSTTSAPSAPRIAAPLNADQFVANPCTALTANDLPALKITTSTTLSNIAYGSPVCDWNTQDAGHAVAIAWVVPQKTGLSSLYDQQRFQRYWQTLSVDDYPAVFADFADLRAQGDCRINVGVNDSLYFYADYQTIVASDKPQACEFAEAAAGDVIKNLQGRH